jgi:hypothetical protein
MVSRQFNNEISMHRLFSAEQGEKMIMYNEVESYSVGGDTT